jgi:hypothetical protein
VPIVCGGAYFWSPRLRSYFYQLLNVHGMNNVGQTEMHTAEPLVPKPIYLRLKLQLKS